MQILQLMKDRDFRRVFLLSLVFFAVFSKFAADSDQNYLYTASVLEQEAYREALISQAGGWWPSFKTANPKMLQYLADHSGAAK